ncbi:hypothetical protein WIW49_10665 [Xanthomonas euroxanthea]
MTLTPYTWDDGVPATIQQHSIAKHEVLREYLVAYLQTLVTTPAQDALSVTLIDGFAGEASTSTKIQKSFFRISLHLSRGIERSRGIDSHRPPKAFAVELGLLLRRERQEGTQAFEIRA